MASIEQHPPVVAPVKPRRRTDPDTQPQRLPPFAVILHNDPINRFEYVVGALKKVFGYGTCKAFVLTLRAHLAGRSLLWSGAKEHAEFKAERLQSCGPDPAMAYRGAQKLRVSIERME